MRLSHVGMLLVVSFLAVTLMASPVIAAKPNPGPDIMAGAVSLSTTFPVPNRDCKGVFSVEQGWSPDSNNPLNIIGGFKNIGGSSGTWDITVTCDGTPLPNTQLRLSLAVGQIQEYQIPWAVPNPDPANQHVFCASAVPVSPTQETNTANNVASCNVAVTSATHIFVLGITQSSTVKKGRLWDVTMKVQVGAEVGIAEGVEIYAEMMRVVGPRGGQSVFATTDSSGWATMLFKGMIAGTYTFRVWSLTKAGCIDYPWGYTLYQVEGIVLQ